jgi:quercetin 2,3-dioxygenase
MIRTRLELVQQGVEGGSGSIELSGLSREAELQVEGRPTQDGAGVRLTRILTRSLQHRLDPFLMLDEFRSDDPDHYIGGFPDHPHRGFETITYLLQGRLRHRDNHGGAGTIGSGDVQWMTAGRGIIHSEMPEQHDGLLHGFQLWLNLPGRDKMIAPSYRDLRAAEIPRISAASGVTVSIIAGDVGGLRGAVLRAATAPLIIDVDFPADTTLELPIPAGHNAFAYVHAGTLAVGSALTEVPTRTLVILSNGPHCDHVRMQGGHEGARVLLVAGRPLQEPIIQHGPFVMNTPEQIAEAIADYEAGRL